jgi:hydrogenase assembly chaperone HypC/HupF
MCVTYPGQVLEVAGGMALVDIQGRRLRAMTTLVPETAEGDWVIVAAGAVLQTIDADEARSIRELLDEALQDDMAIGDGDGRPASTGGQEQ